MLVKIIYLIELNRVDPIYCLIKRIDPSNYSTTQSFEISIFCNHKEFVSNPLLIINC